MLRGLPDRPLSVQELEALAKSDVTGLVFPATPNSIRTDTDGDRRIYDLLISTKETVAAVAYDEDDGWILVGRTAAENPKEAAVDYIIEYRGYDIDDREKVLEFVTRLYESLDLVADEE
jgi:hypothetical protein